MRFAIVVLGVATGCGNRAPSRTVESPVIADAAPVRGDTGEAIAPRPGDPPEPTEPAAECLFQRVVTCGPASPTLSAVGPRGFESCPLTGTATTRSVGRAPVARLSALETRRAWRRDPHVCCYVEFTAQQCR